MDNRVFTAGTGNSTTGTDMKIKQCLVSITAVILLGSGFQAMSQGQSVQEKARQLEEKKQEIERLAKENDDLKQQISEHESTIADFKSQIESLDEKIQEQKDQGAGDSEDNT